MLNILLCGYALASISNVVGRPRLSSLKGQTFSVFILVKKNCRIHKASHPTGTGTSLGGEAAEA